MSCTTDVLFYRGRTRDNILAEDSVSSRYLFSQSLLFGHKKKPILQL